MIEQVAEIIRKTPPNAYNKGVFAHFQAINEEWGLKFYHHEIMRDKTYNLQSIAAEHELGPRLGEKFEMTTPDGKTVYGYITERIKRLSRDIEGSLSQRRMLRQQLEELMEVKDLHDQNCGVTEDGRFVCIDFSHCGDDDLGEQLSWLP